MYDNRRLRFFPATPEIDIYQIIREAQTRWLRPVEVIEILRNFQKFRLNPVPPNKPPSGSLFLFDRKTLRFFRKDGHNWRKKKDGKTVREAHERLKAGSVDVLHCYYAHGEENSSFQRRSYWMLEGAYEHIVLVHYREVTEGSRSSVYRSIQEANANKDNASQTTSVGRPPAMGFSASPGISDNTEVTGPYKSPDPNTPLESEASGDEQDETQNSPLLENQQPSLLQQVSLPNISNFSFQSQPSSSQHIPKQPHKPQASPTVRNLNDVDFDDLLRNPDAYLSPKQPISPAVTLDVSGWKDLLENFRSSPVKVEGQSSASAGVELKSFGTEASNLSNQMYERQSIPANMRQGTGELHHMDVDAGHFFGQETAPEFTPGLNNGPTSFEERRVANSADCYKVSLPEAPPKEDNPLKKLDSFGRWMSREIGDDSQSSLLSGSSDHGAAYWTLEDHTTLDEISSFSHQMNLDVGLSPSVSHDQQFTITDFSPEWAFSTEETKVIVAGNFLKAGAGVIWYCMFGELEVPAEIIHEGVLRCKAPPHAPGRVPFYITRGNRLACSEIRDFEYRSDVVEKYKPTPSETVQIQNERLQMRFAKLISGCPEVNTGDIQCEKIQMLTSNLQQQWKDVEKLAEESSPKERVLETLLKQQLQNWLLCKVSEDGKGPCILDSQGQGALHLAAALGYDWAISPIVASGVVINYRDNHGWTALHWAATFGKENMVSTLLAAGASPGLVTDPTPQYPAGRTPADLAASSGHKGMAGYLAEMSLTSHLTSLTLKEKNASEIESISAVLAEEKAVESISENAGGSDEQVLLQDSLRAVRNAARAAALIHASFRQESFKRRQEKEGVEVADDYGMSLNEVKALSSLGHRKQHNKQNVAATKIQQKFRGWKGRRDYLLFRQRVVTIQAHVRGHQVRRKFKGFLWTVGILDKAVLRWRRKGAGLRNARAAAAAATTENNQNDDDDDEVLRAGRKQKEAAVQKAVTRVQSMVRSHQAREQYQRIQDAVKNAVAGAEQDDDTTMTPGD